MRMLKCGTAVAMVTVGLLLATLARAESFYDQVKPGRELKGRLIVEWMAPNYFLFTPSETEPLTFTRYDGKVIQPGLMFTDGGSIPRPMWVFRNYSPWGYGPAFVIHDWLFHMQNCQLAGADEWTLHSAADVMAEVMKTMMQSKDFHYGSPSTVTLMHTGVLTPPAANAWKDRNCKQPPSRTGDSWRPTVKYEVSFGSGQ